MTKPVHIFIEGSELLGWTEMSLQRSKDQLTGSLNISIFMGQIPDAPVLVDAAHGRRISVYIGGHLSFFGFIDTRRGTGAKHGRDGTTVNEDAASREGATGEGGGRSVSIGPDEYTVQLACRGALKVLIDSSHQHPTTNFLKTTDRQVVEKLLEPWGLQTEWLGEVIDLERYRLRDGSVVLDELNRICREQCHFMYETRDGRLRVTDSVGLSTGEPLLLGVNILTFSAEQNEELAKSEIMVKGQRTKRELWGREAIEPCIKTIRDNWVQTYLPTIVQHCGDGEDAALERRARFEMNKRSSNCKSATIEVFHVQTVTGAPWDVGQLHYVEIPPEGIFDVFECTDITYTVQNDQTLKTSLTLSPPPASGPASGSTTSPAGNLLPIQEFEALGSARRAAAGVTFAQGLYPQPWIGPQLAVIAAPVAIAAGANALLTALASDANKPPLELPKGYESEEPIGGRNSR